MSSVLFVCLGNICRSPMAEAVFRNLINQEEIQFNRIESAGTSSYHIGDDADDRTLACCRKHKIPINHTARRVKATDFNEFDYILGMDHSNLLALSKIQPSSTITATGKSLHSELQPPPKTVCLFGDFLDGQEVPDPYYGDDEEFEKMYQQLTLLSTAFLQDLIRKRSE